MHDTLKFETFVDAYENIFEEYLSSVVAKLSGENEDYRAVQNEIESLYESYPGVLGIFDAERAAALSEQECAAQKQAHGTGNAVRLFPGMLRRSGIFEEGRVLRAVCGLRRIKSFIRRYDL